MFACCVITAGPQVEDKGTRPLSAANANRTRALTPPGLLTLVTLPRAYRDDSVAGENVRLMAKVPETLP